MTGLVRRRLSASLDRVRDHRLTLVTAPAGSGKTTLLAQLAAGWPAPVAWHRVDAADADPAHLIAGLERAVLAAAPGLSGGWRTADDACEALSEWGGEPALVILDDLHVIAGTPGERMVEEFIRRLPGTAVAAAAARRPPGFDVSRLRVSGELHEIDRSDLRFRSWEVDQLFRELYQVALTPAELLEVARRTDGWAAGLHLFHLASRGLPASDRRRVLSSLSGWSRTVRDYVVNNVLDELSPATQDFLLRTSVFDRLTAPLCDRILDAEGSETMLAGLRARQTFLDELDDGVYRYQTLFASVLRGRLVDEVGADEARALQRRAGELLEAEGAVVDALAAYTRAEAWDAIEALVGTGGEQATAAPSGWVEALPPAVVLGDPWLRLARARQHLCAGELDLAVAAYSAAEGATTDPELADVCRRERFGVQVWLDADWAGPLGWSGILRGATQRNPLGARREAAELPGPIGRFVEGISALLAGHLDDGLALLATVVDANDAPPALAAAAQLAGAVIGIARDDVQGLEAAASAADATGLPWLSVAALSVLTVGDWGATPLDALQLAQGRDRVGDRWGAAIACLLGGIGALAADATTDDDTAATGRAAGPLLEEAVARFHGLGAEVLEAWGRSLLAVLRTREGHPDAWGTAATAEQLARRASVPGARAVALAALAACGGPRQAEHRAAADRLSRECTDLGPSIVAAIADRHAGRGAGEAVAADALIGRTREVASLAGRFDAAAAGSVEVVQVVGEAGVGKTRLVGQLAALARSGGARVVWTHAADGSPPYWVVSQAVRTLLERAEAGEVADALGLLAEEVLGLLPERGAGADLAGRADAVHRVRLAEGIGRLLAWASRRHPLVLVVDDAQHADPDTLALLRSLAAQRRSARLLVVIVHRDEELTAAQATALDEPAMAAVVRLQGLRGNDLVELVRDVSGGEPALDLVDSVDRLTGGNPAFVQEALRASVADEGAPAAVTAPAGVRALIERRLRRLEPGATTIICTAAVLSDVDVDLLAAVLGETTGAIRQALADAVDVRLIADSGTGGWRFPTAAIRHVLAERLESDAAATANRRAADVLERRVAAGKVVRPALIARHLFATGDVDADRLLRWVTAAVAEATAAGAPADGVVLCEQALAVTDAFTARADLLALLGTSRRHTEGHTAAQAAFAAAVDSARAAGDPERLARAAVALGASSIDSGHVGDSTVATLEEALYGLGPVDTALRAEVEARLALALPAVARTATRRLDLVAAAQDRAERACDARAVAATLLARHWLEWEPDRRPARLTLLAEARRQAELAGDVEAVLASHYFRRHGLLELGAGAEADLEVALYSRRAVDRRVPMTSWPLGVMRASRALLDGRFAEAERLAANALAATPGVASSPTGQEFFAVQMLVRSRELGRLPAFEAALRRHADQQPENAVWRAALAWVRASSGRTAEARTEIDRFLLDDLASVPHDRNWLPTVALLAETAAALAHKPSAERVLAELDPWAGLVVVAGIGASVLGAVGRFAGDLAALLGWRGAAATHFEQALQAETRLGAGPLVARTKLAYGRLLLMGTGDDQERGRVLVVEAGEAARGYRMATLAAASDAVLASAPVLAVPVVPVPSSTPTPPRPSASSLPTTTPVRAKGPIVATPSPPPGVLLRCFGGYRLELSGLTVHVGVIKPRVRALLWLLSINAGQAIHSEQIIDALWPDADLAAGRRNLQVAISSLRGALEPGVKRGGWARISRDGEAYRLALADDDDVDLRWFDRLLRVALDHRRAGRLTEATAGYDSAVTTYVGDLVPEAGPAEWIVAARDARRLEAVDAAVSLAELWLEQGEPGRVISACRRGLRIDRYRDQLWKLLIAACEQVGDHMEAARARQAYDGVLNELGVSG